MLLWGSAALVGVSAVAFARLADFAQWALRTLLTASTWWPWLLAPLGFAGIAWLTGRYFAGAEGSGIPQTIYALRADAGDRGRLFLRPKVVIGRVLLAALGLFCLF
jgi:H+/Cl- antiporter ClcA